MTYQPPQNILAAILQSRKQSSVNDPGVQMQMQQSSGAQLPAAKAPIDANQIISGFMGNDTQQQPSALGMMTNQAMGQIPGAQPPVNPFAQLTGFGNPNQTNGQNIGAMLAKLFGGG